MPTGYTARLMEKGQTFQEFVMQCARAFGPCSSMRDESLDAPIPEKLPETYYERDYRESKAELAKLDAMDNDERIKEGKRLKKWHLNYSKKGAARSAAEDARLNQMAAEVRAWKPPTDDHKALKDFMLQQISVSYNNNEKYYTGEIARHEAKSPMEYFQESYESARDRVARGEERAQEAIKNRESAEGWLRDLRRSLTGA